MKLVNGREMITVSLVACFLLNFPAREIWGFRLAKWSQIIRLLVQKGGTALLSRVESLIVYQ